MNIPKSISRNWNGQGSREHFSKHEGTVPFEPEEPTDQINRSGTWKVPRV